MDEEGQKAGQTLVRQLEYERKFRKQNPIELRNNIVVRWRHMSRPVKCGMGCMVLVFAFMFVASVLSAILLPMVAMNTTSAQDATRQMERLTDRLEKTRTIISSIEQETESVEGYTRVKTDVGCMKEYLLEITATSTIGDRQSSPEQRLQQCFKHDIVSSIN